MREILFKAKRIDNGEWVEGYLFETREHAYIAYANQFDDDLFLSPQNIFIEVDANTICQYTGLNDNHDNKIWENDIVKCNYNDYGEKGTYIGKVIFREDTCTFVVTDGKSTDYEWWNEEKEVIGNIFDNPELLEGGGEDD